ncbi:MAG TPA: type II toxin-antitoxin system PemK/MazF family toxin [Xanthobacteraceae bacterium]|nr:type II toxin-antitoxin system PemK/MazF family toxin [Xanthobacteraceae bacterium]
MERGDIYLVSLDPATGREQQGKQPVLVLSRSEFNRVTGLSIVAPITTGEAASGERLASPFPSMERARVLPALFAAINRASSTCKRAGGKYWKEYPIIL